MLNIFPLTSWTGHSHGCRMSWLGGWEERQTAPPRHVKCACSPATVVSIVLSASSSPPPARGKCESLHYTPDLNLKTWQNLELGTALFHPLSLSNDKNNIVRVSEICTKCSNYCGEGTAQCKKRCLEGKNTQSCKECSNYCHWEFDIIYI